MTITQEIQRQVHAGFSAEEIMENLRNSGFTYEEIQQNISYIKDAPSSSPKASKDLSLFSAILSLVACISACFSFTKAGLPGIGVFVLCCGIAFFTYFIITKLK